jgi:hypothetical protein
MSAGFEHELGDERELAADDYDGASAEDDGDDAGDDAGPHD